MKPKEIENNGPIKGKRPGTFKRRHDLKIATWNVRSMYRPGALKILSDEALKYKLDILAIQEMRWTGKGMMSGKDFSVCYSCDDRRHTFGTGFLISKKLQASIIDFRPYTPMLCKIRIRGTFFNYSIINAHSPTEDKSDTEKDAFYDLLDDAYSRCPRHDIKIIIGDMNAKIGKDDTCENIGKIR